MIINDEKIEKIEKAFGFALYDWQKSYLKGEANRKYGERGNGKTFAYCLRLLLSDGEQIRCEELRRYADELHGPNYPKWFTRYCIDINKTLVNNGFKTRLIK